MIVDATTCQRETLEAIEATRASLGNQPRRLRRRRRAVSSLAGVGVLMLVAGAALGSTLTIVIGVLSIALLATYLVQLRRHLRQSIEPDRSSTSSRGWTNEELAAWLQGGIAEPISATESGAEDPAGAQAATGRAAGRPLDRWAVTQMLWAGLGGSLYNSLLRLAAYLASDASMGWVRRHLLRVTTALIAYLAQRSVRTVALSALATATTTGFVATAGADAPPHAPHLSLGAILTGAGVTSLPLTTAATSRTYTIQRGDTLSALAARFGTSVQAIASLNRIANPNVIYAGQVLTIPSGSPAVSTASTTPAPAPPPAAVAPPSPAIGYANPLRALSDLVPERVDQGVDYSGSGPIYALGDGVVRNTTNPGWPGGAFISYELSNGPAAGDFVYVAENMTPRVQVGQSVTPTTVLGTLMDGGPGLETGWAQPPGDGNAAAVGQWNGSTSTAYGENFSQLLHALGAPAGETEGVVRGALPPGWPTW